MSRVGAACKTEPKQTSQSVTKRSMDHLLIANATGTYVRLKDARDAPVCKSVNAKRPQELYSREGVTAAGGGSSGESGDSGGKGQIGGLWPRGGGVIAGAAAKRKQIKLAKLVIRVMSRFPKYKSIDSSLSSP